MESELVNEIAFRCGDDNFEDFPRHQYERILNRVKRQIARKYKLNKHKYSFGNNLTDENEVPLDLPYFIAPVSLKVNNVEYELRTKMDFGNQQCHYILQREYNKLLFNYSPKAKGDKLEIVYIADIPIFKENIEDIEPIIPTQYNEELIDLSVMEISKVGIAKFAGKEGNKYTALLQMYAKNIKQYDQELIKKEGWVRLKPKWVIDD